MSETSPRESKVRHALEAVEPYAKDVIIGGLPAGASAKLIVGDLRGKNVLPGAALVTGTGLHALSRKLKEKDPMPESHVLKAPTKTAGAPERVAKNVSQLHTMFPAAAAASGDDEPLFDLDEAAQRVMAVKKASATAKEALMLSPSQVSMLTSGLKGVGTLAKGLGRGAGAVPGALVGAAGGAAAGGPDHRLSGALLGAGVGAAGGYAGGRALAKPLARQTGRALAGPLGTAAEAGRGLKPVVQQTPSAGELAAQARGWKMAAGALSTALVEIQKSAFITNHDEKAPIGQRPTFGLLSSSAEQASADGKGMVDTLSAHSHEMHALVESQLGELFRNKGYGRARALGRRRADVDSEINRAFAG